MAILDNERLLAYLDSERDKLIAVARITDTSAAIPSTPGWNVTELLSHLDWVYRFVIGNVRDGDETPPPTNNLWPDEAVAQIEATSTELIELLTEADPTGKAWSWTRDHTIGFWVRRMAHETMIHRVDLQIVNAAVEQAPSEFAADGIDELLSTYLVGRKIWQQLSTPSTTRINTIDTNETWHVEIGEQGARIGRNPQPADLTVEGTAWQLELALWGRADASTITADGDKGLWQKWLDLAW